MRTAGFLKLTHKMCNIFMPHAPGQCEYGPRSVDLFVSVRFHELSDFIMNRVSAKTSSVALTRL